MPVSHTTPCQPDDASLISRSLGDPGVFAELYDEHAAAIFRFAVRRLGAQAAEDILAETFLAAFRRRDRYDLSRTDARPWLYGIAVNLIAKHHRAEVRMLRALARTGLDPLDGEELERIDERIAAAQTRRALAAALATLPASDRDVLLLVAWEELSYDEVAAALRIPVGTVRSRLHRARRRIRLQLAQHANGDGGLT